MSEGLLATIAGARPTVANLALQTSIVVLVAFWAIRPVSVDPNLVNFFVCPRPVRKWRKWGSLVWDPYQTGQLVLLRADYSPFINICHIIALRKTNWDFLGKE